MLLKIGIIAVILVVGGIIFYSEIQEIFPNTTTTGLDSFETDVNTLTEKSLESVEKKIGSGVERVETKISELKQNSTAYVEEKIAEKLSFSDSGE